ncbi:OLC1v1001815C1 [Oldenlandia corymbosa var. corymbosa]|uniref:OLC1v1001815C1 n=1 Tax=Oldenlandia corymbosa var. corymbosa TaxID=529605 RepID=A0AAV1D7C2_OLDCO|nr:OLC1v1001815C1 [Oldenlandia corymbosa var. corymbosa]
MSASFYDILETTPSATLLDDMDFMPDLFILNVPDFLPTPETHSLVSVFDVTFTDSLGDSDHSMLSLHSSDMVFSEDSQTDIRAELLDEFLAAQLHSVSFFRCL